MTTMEKERERRCDCPLPCQCNVPTENEDQEICQECRIDLHMNKRGQRVDWMSVLMDNSHVELG